MTLYFKLHLVNVRSKSLLFCFVQTIKDASNSPNINDHALLNGDILPHLEISLF